MKKFNQFFCSGMQSAFFSGLLAAFFCFSPVAVEAQLTSQDVEDAVYNALYEYALLVAGSETLRTIPYDGYGSPLYAWMRVTSGTNPNTASFARAWHPIFTRLDTAIPLLVRALEGSTNQLDNLLSVLGFDEMDTAAWYLSELENDLDWVSIYSGDIDAKLQFLNFISGSHGSALLVTDPEVLDALQSLDQSVSGYGATLGDIRDNTATLDSIQGYFSSVAGDLSAWREEWNGAQSLYEEQDSSSRTNAAIALRDAESDYNTEETTALQEVEDLDPPTAVDTYVPTPPDEDLAGSDMGLGSVNANVVHDARITLVPRRRSGATGSLPPIEIDYGRMSSLVSAMESFADWADWLYGSLFAILFSVKGIHMWRVFRVASLQASVGVDPQISLAWDPF